MSAAARVEVEAIWISPGHDFVGRHGMGRLEHEVVTVDEVECHAGKGLVGDRFYEQADDFKGQITFFSAEVADAVRKELELPNLEPSEFRRNVLVRGLDLNSLVGKTFSLGGLRLTGSEECSPCYWMDEAVGPGTHKRMIGRGGLRCRILNDSTLHRGAVELKILGSDASEI